MARLYGLTWLARQSSARWRRVKWGVNQLADELWTVMSRLRDQDPEATEVTGQDGEVTNTTTTNEFDNTFQEIFEFETTIEQGVEITTVTRTAIRWDRTPVPCKVLEKIDSETPSPTEEVGFQTYTIELYPHGLSVGIYLDQFDPRDGDDPPPVVTDIGVQLQIDQDEVIPSGTWVTATRIVKSQITITETFDSRTGIFIGSRQQITPLEIGNFFQVPIWLGERPAGT